MNSKHSKAEQYVYHIENGEKKLPERLTLKMWWVFQLEGISPFIRLVSLTSAIENLCFYYEKYIFQIQTWPTWYYQSQMEFVPTERHKKLCKTGISIVLKLLHIPSLLNGCLVDIWLILPC